jgi:sugar phosphate isomerase/epimerase
VVTAQPTIGVQLFSVRDALAADIGGTLRKLAEAGFSHVEPFNILSNPRELKSALADAGLGAVTAHANVIGPDANAVLDAAELLGLKTVIVASVTKGRYDTEDGVASAAADLNAAAKKAADRGIRVGYHNHDTELAQRFGGTPVLELLAAQLEPEVLVQVDAHWAAVGGVDVPALLRRLGDRVRFLHLDDGPIDEIAEVLAATPALELPVVELVDRDSDMFVALHDARARLTNLISA